MCLRIYIHYILIKGLCYNSGMKLFLASEGNDSASLIQLNHFVGGLQNKKVLFIPTAAIGASTDNSWKLESCTLTDLEKYEAKVSVLELENQKPDKENFNTLAKPDIIWITGGKASYLLSWIYKTHFDVYIRSQLQSGTVYVGSSSGSMICSNTQYATKWYIGEPDPEIQNVRGMGLIDFEIYPHYEDDQFNQIENLWKQGTLYLLKNGEVITIDGDTTKVLGKTRIISK